MSVAIPEIRQPKKPNYALLYPALLLCCAYGLLGLTFTSHLQHHEIMQRCVLVDPKMSKIWSVANIEIGLAYLGVFSGMAYYLFLASRTDKTHLVDLSYGLAYLLGSFLLDFACVTFLNPFAALLVGDAIVMSFTLVVSRHVWFQRLLGIFVPLVFITCSLGHFMEGISYWKLTYPVNVPWTMVTADIGFAILVNTARFPAFIRGEDIVSELNRTKAEARIQQDFFRDVLLSVTEGRLRLCQSSSELPATLPSVSETLSIRRDTLAEIRHSVITVGHERHFSRERLDTLVTAVSEGAMNAVVHGGGGTVRLCGDSQALQIWITDKGPGIALTELPRAALERGYSTKDSLGHGFWLMLRTADNIDLLTGSEGTTLVITFYQEPPSALGQWAV